MQNIWVLLTFLSHSFQLPHLVFQDIVLSVPDKMDKIRMRLVRSQSMGVGMGSSGIMGSSGNLAGTTGRPAPTPYQPDSGRNASIVLLDERRLEMLIQPRLFAGELLDLVASHCALKEKEYFGLAVVDDNGQYTW